MEIANILKDNSRGQDSVARWGGEEFLLLVPETDIKGAVNLAEKIREKVEAFQFSYHGEMLNVTMSFGVAEFDLEVGFEATVKEADLALYESKECGRNCVMSK